MRKSQSHQKHKDYPLDNYRRNKLNELMLDFGNPVLRPGISDYLQDIVEAISSGCFDFVINTIAHDPEAYKPYPKPWQFKKLITQYTAGQDPEKTYDECYYCDGTGLVPYNRIEQGMKYRVMSPCQCSAGNAMMEKINSDGKKIFTQNYFEIHREIQYQRNPNIDNYHWLAQVKSYEN